MALKVEVESAPESGVWNDYTSLTMMDSLQVTSSGGADAGTSSALLRDIAGTAVVLPECGWRVTDGSTVVFRGKIKKRGKTEKYTNPRGKWYSITAQDATSLLVDDICDTAALRSTAESDQDRIIWLVTTFGTKGVTAVIPGSGGFVQSLYGSMMPEVDYTGMSLYEAINDVLKYSGGSIYVDVNLALHHFKTESNPAPFNLSDNPNGSTTFGYDGFDAPDDSLDLTNAVYVIGAGGTGEWVTDATSISTYGRKESAFEDATLEDSTARQAAGNAILEKYKDPRGPIKLTVYKPGLRAGMTIQITNSTWGLTAVTYRIQQVDATILGTTSSFKYEVSLQDAPVTLQNQLNQSFDRTNGDVKRSTNAAVDYAAQFLVGRVKVVAALPALPDPNYPIGMQVFLTADNKLYRNPDDIAWTASVNLPDGVGQITGTQIANDAISTPHIAANSIDASMIQAGAITADQIAANTIVAGNIAAGAIGAEALAGQIILADKMFMTDVAPNQRVEISDAGISAYDANNQRVVNIPSQGTEPVEVIGKIETGDFTSNASAELRGTNTLAGSSVTTLQQGIINPPATPSVSVATRVATLLASAPAQPGYGLDRDSSGYGGVATFWVGADPTVGNLLDLAYEYRASDGALLRTLRKTGTTTTATTTAGSTSHVSDSAQARQETGVQVATPITIPSNLVNPKITKVSVYATGYNGGTPTIYGCVWSTGNTKLGNTASATLPAEAFANGNSNHYDMAFSTPLAVTAGSTYRVGWYQTNNEGIQWDRDDGSSKTQYRGTGGSGNLSITETLTANKPNVYVTIQHTVDSSVEGAVAKIVGVARAGSYIFVLDANGLLLQYNQSDLSYVGQTSLASYMGGNKANAGLGYTSNDGYLTIATATGVTGTDQVRLVKVNATTRAYVSTLNCTGFAVNGSTGGTRGVFYDGANYVVNCSGVNRIFGTAAGAYAGGGYDFGVVAELAGGACNGAYTWGGGSNRNIYCYDSSWDASSGSDRTFYFSYAWYKSTATIRETARSPLASIVAGRRRYVTISNPAIPVVAGETPDRVRIYAYPDSSPAAGASWLQTTDANTNRTLSSYTGSGTHDQTSNGFPLGDPAQLKSVSQSPGWTLKGDGSATMPGYDSSKADTGWHEIGGSGEPAFTNSWVNYGSSYQTAGFRRDAMGFVHLKGLVKSGTLGSAMFTLPAGYRPALTAIFAGHSNTTGSALGDEGRIDIFNTGAVTAHSTEAKNGWVSLDGIVYYGDQ